VNQKHEPARLTFDEKEKTLLRWQIAKKVYIKEGRITDATIDSRNEASDRLGVINGSESRLKLRNLGT
jgi:hypothetical protein